MRIAKTIKLTATILFAVEVIIATIWGIIIIAKGGASAYIGVIVFFGGPAVAFVSLLLLAGFGEIIEKLCLIERNTRSNEIKSEAQSLYDFKRIEEIEKLRYQNLITEEEYRQAISRVKRGAQNE